MTSRLMKDAARLTPLMKKTLQKQILQKDKIINKKEKENAKLHEKVEKLQERLNKKDEKKAKKDPIKWEGELHTTALTVTNLCEQIYKKFPFGAKEHHYQAALEAELCRAGIITQQEVAIVYKIHTISGEVIQLPHDIRGREDLLCPREKMILELKQVRTLGDSENLQLLRYMDQRRRFSEWGEDTKGMLINFGDDSLEIWFIKYLDDETQHIRLKKTPRELHKSWEKNAFLF
jgi:GxxExxY protein